MFVSVVTTIQPPTKSIRTLARRLAEVGGLLIVAGDVVGPDQYVLPELQGGAGGQLSFLSIDEQYSSGFRLARVLPTKHYSRKNIAYLKAVQDGARCVYETDDDNAPLASWHQRCENIDSASVIIDAGSETPHWVNVYRHFSTERIWPRGLPLSRIHGEFAEVHSCHPFISDDGRFWAPIQQGLADGSPDVDAIWRLVQDREFRFDEANSVMLPPGQWCPFNTQSTWWWPAVYPLLYIPSFCSFRMCDIWKSFVAQRCLWELGTGVVFHAPEVWQDRNVHDLMRDFNEEVPGYQQNHRIATILEAASLKEGVEHVGENLRTCYEHLIDAEVFPVEERELVEAWLADVADANVSR